MWITLPRACMYDRTYYLKKELAYLFCGCTSSRNCHYWNGGPPKWLARTTIKHDALNFGYVGGMELVLWWFRISRGKGTTILTKRCGVVAAVLTAHVE